MNTALDLSIRCKYTRKLSAEELSEAKRILQAAAQFLADRGMLTGESVTGSDVLELDSCSFKVTGYWGVIGKPAQDDVAALGSLRDRNRVLARGLPTVTPASPRNC
jgi:hypothetical protein